MQAAGRSGLLLVVMGLGCGGDADAHLGSDKVVYWFGEGDESHCVLFSPACMHLQMHCFVLHLRFAVAAMSALSCRA
jgi:N-dimethylarginine dimethylaminohydrolase